MELRLSRDHTPRQILNAALKQNTGQRLLGFSVLRETSMTSVVSIEFQKAELLQAKGEGQNSNKAGQSKGCIHRTGVVGSVVILKQENRGTREQS